MRVEAIRKRALSQFNGRAQEIKTMNIEYLRLECLRLALSKGAGEPVEEATRYFNFVSGFDIREPRQDTLHTCQGHTSGPQPDPDNRG